MNIEQKENIKQWVEALRSGKYLQGQGALLRSTFKHDQGEYCCLGVASNISNLGYWVSNESMTRSIYCDNSGEEQLGHLTKAVAKYYGINVDTEHALAKMNDSQNKSFKDIADYLEQTYLGSQ